MQTRSILTVAAASALLASAAIAGPAAAAPAPGAPETRASGLPTPLGLAVATNGDAVVSGNFAGLLSSVGKRGVVTNLAAAPGEEISAPAVDGGTVYYMRGSNDHTAADIYALRGGTSTHVADIAGFEASENPDQVNTYGFSDLDESCEAAFPNDPDDVLTWPNYPGQIDTHAYGATVAGGILYVADAGANAIFAVDPASGDVSTVAVLPPAAPIVVPAPVAAEFGWPDCAVGHEYRTEPVPTDVELGPDGWLYVTSLPGGPETPEFGPRGNVVKVDPSTGEVAPVAAGFNGATGLAVAPNGTIFVAELFGGPAFSGQVAIVKPGESAASSAIDVVMPAAVSVRAEQLYITTEALSEEGGKLTVVPLKGSAHSRRG
ncbi:ScyD/ScyE family protein [Agromyces sp. NPDC058136]|uniref:ScyD/ScyE family protein n=1 Tax=Agromyces sp. NPDC058136 TaxID=3346354 RepID=UPI0036DC2604